MSDKQKGSFGRIYIDGAFNFSYGEMLYGKYGFKNKKMYCKNCEKHFKFCKCEDKPKFILQ